MIVKAYNKFSFGELGLCCNEGCNKRGNSSLSCMTCTIHDKDESMSWGQHLGIDLSFHKIVRDFINSLPTEKIVEYLEVKTFLLPMKLSYYRVLEEAEKQNKIAGKEIKGE